MHWHLSRVLVIQSSCRDETNTVEAVCSFVHPSSWVVRHCVTDSMFVLSESLFLIQILIGPPPPPPGSPACVWISQQTSRDNDATRELLTRGWLIWSLASIHLVSRPNHQTHTSLILILSNGFVMEGKNKQTNKFRSPVATTYQLDHNLGGGEGPARPITYTLYSQYKLSCTLLTPAEMNYCHAPCPSWSAPVCVWCQRYVHWR